MTKRYFIVVVVIILVLSLGVFSIVALELLKKGNEVKPVKLYYADNISRSHQLAIDEFNRIYKGRIEVVPVNLPFSKFSTNERKELLARSLRSKSEKLDIFAVDLIWVPRFAKWCEPLDSYFTEAEKNRLIKDALKSCIYEDKLVAMPMYLDIGLMYYRSDIIRKLPDGEEIEKKLQESITWDELLKLRDRLHYTNKPFFLFPAKDFEGLVCFFLELAVAYDTNYLKFNTFNINSIPARKSLQMLVDFVKNGITPKAVVDFDEYLCNRYMLDNDGVFLRSWPDFIQNIKTSYPDAHPDTIKLKNIGKAPLPCFWGKKSTSVFGGWNLMVSKSSTKKAEAIEFIRYFQSEKNQRMIFENTRYLPILKSIYEDKEYLSEHEEFALFYKLLKQGFHRPALVEYTKLSDIISRYIHLAIKGDLSVDEALVKCDEQIRLSKVLQK